MATSPYLLPINDVIVDVIIIKLTAFIQNKIPHKTYISDFLNLENNRIYAYLP